jgi:formylglycine-generating enzyme required for sulfatase activity
MKRAIALMAVLACCSCEQGPSSSRSQTPPIINTTDGQEMVRIPAGEFMMGSNRGQADEAPAHKVRVNSFLMDRTEVTQEMYEKLRLVNPSKVKGPKLPVHMMSWVLAARYCNARSKAEGLEACYNEDNATCDFTRNGYRLPTEAEWEYACRAGLEGDSSLTSDPAKIRKNVWFADDSGGKPHPVAEKAPNAWGLYDMIGNVGEWCNDMYDKQYYRKSPAEDPRGPDQGDQYVVRGGSYNSSSEALRPSARVGSNPGFSDACLAPETLGFRCARKADASASAPGPK